MSPTDNLDRGDAADQPNAGPGNKDKFYFAEDTGEFSISDGTQWIVIATVGGGGAPTPMGAAFTVGPEGTPAPNYRYISVQFPVAEVVVFNAFVSSDADGNTPTNVAGDGLDLGPDIGQRLVNGSYLQTYKTDNTGLVRIQFTAGADEYLGHYLQVVDPYDGSLNTSPVINLNTGS